MWLVRLALRRPYTTAVLCALIMLMGLLSVRRMPVDIFPTIDIPVVTVIWSYNGLPAEEMERRVVFLSERSMSTSVNGIDHIESQSIQGIGLLKVYFQPGTDIGTAIAQISSISNSVTAAMPPGITPPTVIQFNASNVPVVQITAKGKGLPEQQVVDYALNFIRVRLFTVPGLSTPFPYGGKQRQVTVDIDPAKLAARGLGPADVVTALSAGNVILPAGLARMGNKEIPVLTNGSPASVDDFHRMPLKVVGGAPVLLGDVAHVYDGFADQTNIVRINGERATYMAIIKKGEASTLAVVDAARGILPAIQAAAPKGMELKLDFDQSAFVRNAIKGVLHEAVVASILVCVMILLFLGSWRSMAIVCTSIPLSIFAGLVGLKLTGQGLNIMTLGGFSLAIGMLVDDATVEVENIHRNQAMGKPLTVAILDGAKQIAVPAIVATLSICIVFFPVVLLVGPSRYLFTPLAMAVVFSMLASYLLSRTLVPTLSRMLMGHDGGAPDGFLARFNARRERLLDALRDRYGRGLEVVLHHRAAVMVFAVAFVLVSLGLLGVLGRDFFPQVDAGLMKLHMRAPAGTRLEDTEVLAGRVEAVIRRVVPPEELEGINTNIGLPVSFNLAFVASDNVTSQDADISISLKPGHKPTATYMKALRQELPRTVPGAAFYFQSADIVSQVLNFGVPAPIDIQVEGMNLGLTYPLAQRIERAVRGIPGAVDVRLKQVLDAPAYRVNVDRLRAARLGLTQKDAANGLLVSLSGNGQLAPSFFLNPANGVNYRVVVRTPTHRMDSPSALMATPFAVPGGAAFLQPEPARSQGSGGQAAVEPLAAFAGLSRATTPNEVDHATVQRVLDVMAGVEDRDLGSVVEDIQAAIQGLGELPPGVRIRVRGQYEVMQESFRSLGGGLIIAIILVYLLMVVLYQSWLDPFIIMAAVPGALVGILWMLALTGTTLNVESLMGAIMAVGIAVSNSILLVSFANDCRVARPQLSALEAALEAGRTRLRPVLMTALAMILGMLPMALALGEGGSQNAPLGRAVIGGLLMATFTTLFVVPVVYSLLRRKPPTAHLLEAQFQEEQQGSEV